MSENDAKFRPLGRYEDYVKYKPLPAMTAETVNHPDHYGGPDDAYEAIRVIEAWGANFNIGNALKYLKRYPTKGGAEDLRKAIFYIMREARKLEGEQDG